MFLSSTLGIRFKQRSILVLSLERGRVQVDDVERQKRSLSFKLGEERREEVVYDKQRRKYVCRCSLSSDDDVSFFVVILPIIHLGKRYLSLSIRNTAKCNVSRFDRNVQNLSCSVDETCPVHE